MGDLPVMRGQELLDALATGRMTQQAIESLWLAAQMWLGHGGVVPLNRYLELPASPDKLRQASRDYWLRKAARLMPENGPWLDATALHRELSAFASRGPWCSWRDKSEPPADASALRSALFWVMRHNSGDVPGARTVYRALT